MVQEVSEESGLEKEGVAGFAALHEFHCSLPPGSAALYCKNRTTHCPKAARQCVVGVPLPPTARH